MRPAETMLLRVRVLSLVLIAASRARAFLTVNQQFTLTTIATATATTTATKYSRSTAFSTHLALSKDINNSIKDDNDDGPLFSSSSSPSSLQNFNPFQPINSQNTPHSNNNVSGRTTHASNMDTQNVVSLRKVQMQAILQELLSVADSSGDQMTAVLASNRDFLLAPFVDDDEDDSSTNNVFLDDDPDSIYTADQTPAQRWQTFQSTMTERIAHARNPSVKTVLRTLLEYLQQEEQQEGDEA